MADFYAILGVPPTATEAEIKERYRFLAHAYHPDKFSSDSHKREAEARFKEINEAYRVLSDPIDRARYHRYRHTEPSSQQTADSARSKNEYSQETYKEHAADSPPPKSEYSQREASQTEEANLSFLGYGLTLFLVAIPVIMSVSSASRRSVKTPAMEVKDASDLRPSVAENTPRMSLQEPLGATLDDSANVPASAQPPSDQDKERLIPNSETEWIKVKFEKPGPLAEGTLRNDSRWNVRQVTIAINRYYSHPSAPKPETRTFELKFQDRQVNPSAEGVFSVNIGDYLNPFRDSGTNPPRWYNAGSKVRVVAAYGTPSHATNPLSSDPQIRDDSGGVLVPAEIKRFRFYATKGESVTYEASTVTERSQANDYQNGEMLYVRTAFDSGTVSGNNGSGPVTVEVGPDSSLTFTETLLFNNRTILIVSAHWDEQKGGYRAAYTRDIWILPPQIAGTSRKSVRMVSQYEGIAKPLE